MSIIDDFKDINRRMNRKPEPNPYSQLMTAIGQLCSGSPFELPDLRHLVPNIEKDRNGPNG